MLTNAIAAIEAEIAQRRTIIAGCEHDIVRLSSAVEELRAVLPATAVAVLPVAPPPAPKPMPPVEPADVVDEMQGAYPEVRARRARVLAAVPMRESARCQDIARALNLPQSHVQSDLEHLAGKGLVERTGWGKWKQRVVEEVVWSGRDSLYDPNSPAFARPGVSQ